MKTLLHVGCGTSPLPDGYKSYKEVRLDCDPASEPDIVASIVALPMIPKESHDAIFASHVLEHLFAHEANMALAEMFRVLKPDGILEVFVPDLQGIGAKLALDQLEEPLYLSNIGPISPMDMIYGHRGSVAQGRASMAHKTGFTASVLRSALKRAGFEKVLVEREQHRGSAELKAIAVKGKGVIEDAGQEPGATGVPERPLRTCVG